MTPPYDSPEQLSDINDVADVMSRFWAAEQDPDKLYSTLSGKLEAYYEALDRRGFFAMARMAYGMYYGLGFDGENQFKTQRIRFTGEDGENVEFNVNEFRALCDQIFNMAVKNRPAFQAQAINTDPQTLGQINASDSIIKYYYEQVFGERKEKEVVKCEGLYGKGWTHIDWDPDGGPDVEIPGEMVETEMGPIQGAPQKVKAGSFIIERKYLWDVAHEVFRSEHDEHLWRLVVGCRSKWEMIARYPVYATKIEELEGGQSEWAQRFPGYDSDVEFDKDMVPVWTFYHAKTAALPKGRKATYVGNCQVDSDDLPIDTIPLIEFMSCELDGTSLGISDLWNLIPIAQMKNQILSDLASSIEAFGSPPLAVPENTDWDIDALANGRKVLVVPSTAPEFMPKTVEFPQPPAFGPQMLDILRKFDQSLTGLNAISRGEADASVKSGAHAALYHAMAVEAQAPRGAQVDLHRERVANTLLQFLKRYALHPQLVAIAGEDERPYLQMFSAKDIAHVHRVVIKTANPMMRTQAGRLQVAELLRDWPGTPLKNPNEVLELITSGVLKPLVQPQRVQNLRIKQENALLAAGPQVVEKQGEVDPMTGMPTMTRTVPTVPVLATDHAAEHIWGHLEVLVSPDSLENPAKFDATLTHIQEHIETARNGDPYTAQLLGLPPPMMAGMAGVDPNATSSGKEGPSNKDMEKVEESTTPPNAEPPATSPEANNDKLGARIPKPAQPPNMAGS